MYPQLNHLRELASKTIERVEFMKACVEKMKLKEEADFLFVALTMLDKTLKMIEDRIARRID